MRLLGCLQKKALMLIMVFYLIIASAGIFYNYSLFNTAGDEAPLLSATLKMISDHSLRPNYPSFYHLSLGVYLYLPFFLFFLFLMRFSGLYPDMESIKQFGQIDFAKFLPLARFISVLCGLAALYLLYKICEKLFKDKVSDGKSPAASFIPWLAAFFLATNLIFVQQSHFARIWLPQTLTVLLAFYFIVDLYLADKEKIKNYLLCGFSIGLAFGTHVVGIFIYASFLAAHYLKNKSGKFKEIILSKYFWLANALFAIIYFITYYLNTYGFSRYLGGIFLNFNKMLSLSDTFNVFTDKAEILNQPGANTISKTLIYYLSVLWQFQPVLLLLFVLGSIVMIIKKRDIFIIIYFFIIVYLLGISSISMKGARFLLPIIPFLAIFAAYGLNWLYQNVKYKKIIGGLIVIFCLLSLYPPLLWDYKFLLPSTRLEAVGWIYNNLPANAGIINLDGGLELNENRQSLLDIKKYTNFLTKKRAYLLNSADEIFPKPNYYVLFYPHYEKVPPEILNKKFAYLIISWLDRDDYKNNLAKLKNLNLTENNLILLKRFPANANADDIGFDLGGDIVKPLEILPKLKQNGPIIDIYKLKY